MTQFNVHADRLIAEAMSDARRRARLAGFKFVLLAVALALPVAAGAWFASGRLWQAPPPATKSLDTAPPESLGLLRQLVGAVASVAVVLSAAMAGSFLAARCSRSVPPSEGALRPLLDEYLSKTNPLPPGGGCYRAALIGRWPHAEHLAKAMLEQWEELHYRGYPGAPWIVEGVPDGMALGAVGVAMSLTTLIALLAGGPAALTTRNQLASLDLGNLTVAATFFLVACLFGAMTIVSFSLAHVALLAEREQKNRRRTPVAAAPAAKGPLAWLLRPATSLVVALFVWSLPIAALSLLGNPPAPPEGSVSETKAATSPSGAMAPSAWPRRTTKP